MPPKIKPIKISLPYFTSCVSFACELLILNDFDKERTSAYIQKSINSVVGNEYSVRKFYIETKKYVETAIIQIGEENVSTNKTSS